MSKVNVIETVSERVTILTSLKIIIMRAMEELRMQRLFTDTRSNKDGPYYCIKQKGRRVSSLIWLEREEFPVIEVRIKRNRKKVIATIQNLAILEIAKEELLKMTEELGINDLVIMKDSV